MKFFKRVRQGTDVTQGIGVENRKLHTNYKYLATARKINVGVSAGLEFQSMSHLATRRDLSWMQLLNAFPFVTKITPVNMGTGNGLDDGRANSYAFLARAQNSPGVIVGINEGVLFIKDFGVPSAAPVVKTNTSNLTGVVSDGMNQFIAYRHSNTFNFSTNGGTAISSYSFPDTLESVVGVHFNDTQGMSPLIDKLIPSNIFIMFTAQRENVTTTRIRMYTLGNANSTPVLAGHFFINVAYASSAQASTLVVSYNANSISNPKPRVIANYVTPDSEGSTEIFEVSGTFAAAGGWASFTREITSRSTSISSNPTCTTGPSGVDIIMNVGVGNDLDELSVEFTVEPTNTQFRMPEPPDSVYVNGFNYSQGQFCTSPVVPVASGLTRAANIFYPVTRGLRPFGTHNGNYAGSYIPPTGSYSPMFSMTRILLYQTLYSPNSLDFFLFPLIKWNPETATEKATMELVELQGRIVMIVPIVTGNNAVNSTACGHLYVVTTEEIYLLELHIGSFYWYSRRFKKKMHIPEEVLAELEGAYQQRPVRWGS